MRFNFKVRTRQRRNRTPQTTAHCKWLTLLFFFCLVFQRSRNGLPQGEFVVHVRRQLRDRPRGQSDIEIRSQKVIAQFDNRVSRAVRV